jgi:hypothetical protein
LIDNAVERSKRFDQKDSEHGNRHEHQCGDQRSSGSAP